MVSVLGCFRVPSGEWRVILAQMLDPPLPPIFYERFFGSSYCMGSWNRFMGVFFRMITYFSVSRWGSARGAVCSIRGCLARLGGP